MSPGSRADWLVTTMHPESTSQATPDTSTYTDHNTSSYGISSQTTPLQGSVLVLIQFDVCEEIRLDELRKIFGARTAEASFKHQAPGYVRYQRPPVVETLDPVVLDGGERLEGQIKYYDYGVVSLVFELPFSGDWEKLIQISCRWTSDTNFESIAS